VAAGGGYLIAEGAVGSCCCDLSWATSPHGNAATKTRINQNLIQSFIIAASRRDPWTGPHSKAIRRKGAIK